MVGIGPRSGAGPGRRDSERVVGGGGQSGNSSELETSGAGGVTGRYAVPLPLLESDSPKDQVWNLGLCSAAGWAIKLAYALGTAFRVLVSWGIDAGQVGNSAADVAIDTIGF